MPRTPGKPIPHIGLQFWFPLWRIYKFQTGGKDSFGFRVVLSRLLLLSWEISDPFLPFFQISGMGSFDPVRRNLWVVAVASVTPEIRCFPLSLKLWVTAMGFFGGGNRWCSRLSCHIGCWVECGEISWKHVEELWECFGIVLGLDHASINLLMLQFYT